MGKEGYFPIFAKRKSGKAINKGEISPSIACHMGTADIDATGEFFFGFNQIR